MSQKIYIGSGKEIQTKNGGKLMKLSLNRDDIEKLRQNLNLNGWVNLILSGRKNPSPSGSTHYLVVDDWQPSAQKIAPIKDEVITPRPADYLESLNDDMPF